MGGDLALSLGTKFSNDLFRKQFSFFLNLILTPKISDDLF